MQFLEIFNALLGGAESDFLTFLSLIQLFGDSGE
jgi:hypothetical protein